MKARNLITILAIIPIFLASCTLRNSPQQQNSPFSDRDSNDDLRSRRDSNSRDDFSDRSRDDFRDDSRDRSRDDFQDDSRERSREFRDSREFGDSNRNQDRRYRNHNCRNR